MTEGRDDRRGAEHPDRDHVDVVALVLGDVDGQRRAEMAAHLLVCASCRSEYDEVAATVGDLLPAVPAVQPPLGFDVQLLGRLGTGGAQRPGRTRPRRWVWLAGAAALVAIAVAGALGWRTTRDGGEQAGAVVALEKVDGGDPVGTVSIGEVDGERVMVVAVVGAPDDVSYMCRTTFADGSTADSEAWAPGNGAWIVPLPPGPRQEVRTVELVVTGTDHVWSTASFGEI